MNAAVPIATDRFGGLGPSDASLSPNSSELGFGGAMRALGATAHSAFECDILALEIDGV